MDEARRLEVEDTMRRFFDRVGAFDYAGLGPLITRDFELIHDAERLDRDGFEAFLKRYEHNTPLAFELSELKTKTACDLGYTSYRLRESNGVQWLESAVLRLVDDHWLVDRCHATTVPRTQS